MQPKTKEEARQYAIDWQRWASEQNLSTVELIEWRDQFQAIAEVYGLLEEFTENGII